MKSTKNSCNVEKNDGIVDYDKLKKKRVLEVILFACTDDGMFRVAESIKSLKGVRNVKC